jgi:hypothetical protein
LREHPVQLAREPIGCTVRGWDWRYQSKGLCTAALSL